MKSLWKPAEKVIKRNLIKAAEEKKIDEIEKRKN